jgi:hypothetical protein
VLVLLVRNDDDDDDVGRKLPAGFDAIVGGGALSKLVSLFSEAGDKTRYK